MLTGMVGVGNGGTVGSRGEDTGGIAGGESGCIYLVAWIGV